MLVLKHHGLGRAMMRATGETSEAHPGDAVSEVGRRPPWLIRGCRVSFICIVVVASTVRLYSIVFIDH